MGKLLRTKTSAKVVKMSKKEISTQKATLGKSSEEMRRENNSRRVMNKASFPTPLLRRQYVILDVLIVDVTCASEIPTPDVMIFDVTCALEKTLSPTSCVQRISDVFCIGNSFFIYFFKICNFYFFPKINYNESSLYFVKYSHSFFGLN